MRFKNLLCNTMKNQNDFDIINRYIDSDKAPEKINASLIEIAAGGNTQSSKELFLKLLRKYNDIDLEGSMILYRIARSHEDSTMAELLRNSTFTSRQIVETLRCLLKDSTKDRMILHLLQDKRCTLNIEIADALRASAINKERAAILINNELLQPFFTVKQKFNMALQSLSAEHLLLILREHPGAITLELAYSAVSFLAQTEEGEGKNRRECQRLIFNHPRIIELGPYELHSLHIDTIQSAEYSELDPTAEIRALMRISTLMHDWEGELTSVINSRGDARWLQFILLYAEPDFEQVTLAVEKDIDSFSFFMLLEKVDLYGTADMDTLIRTIGTLNRKRLLEVLLARPQSLSSTQVNNMIRVAVTYSSWGCFDLLLPRLDRSVIPPRATSTEQPDMIDLDY